jgi:hypothetical protein
MYLVHGTPNALKILQDGAVRPYYDLKRQNKSHKNGYCGDSAAYHDVDKKINAVFLTFVPHFIHVDLVRQAAYALFGTAMIFDISLLLNQKFGYSQFWNYGYGSTIVDGSTFSQRQLEHLLETKLKNNYNNEITTGSFIVMPYLREIYIDTNNKWIQVNKILDLLEMEYPDVVVHKFKQWVPNIPMSYFVPSPSNKWLTDRSSSATKKRSKKYNRTRI